MVKTPAGKARRDVSLSPTGSDIFRVFSFIFKFVKNQLSDFGKFQYLNFLKLSIILSIVQIDLFSQLLRGMIKCE